MNLDKHARRAWLSWWFVGALFGLCGVLGFLQYRWTGEVSIAARERLRGSLEASLNRLSRDLNSEITSACRALLEPDPQSVAQEPEKLVEARYREWKNSTRQGQMFLGIGIAEPHGGTIVFRRLDLDTGTFAPADWPPAWKTTRERLEAMLASEPGVHRRPPGPPPEDEGLVFELPFFDNTPGVNLQDRPPQPPELFGRGEAARLIVELNPRYVGGVLLPELVQRYLGSGGSVDYQVEVVARSNPTSIVYQSDADLAPHIAATADASVGLVDLQYDRLHARSSPPGFRGRGPGRAAPADTGRWQMFVRHRAGSLEAVVSRARWSNLAVTAGVLLLMLATLAAWIRYSRRAQRLAELQLDFVAGVSHELRTPLAVIHTAAYNLCGSVADNPGQVKRYGALIQQESGRLKDLVEQVLRFAGSNAGQVVREREPVAVEAVIEDTLEASKAVLEGSHCAVEKTIESGLPLILADRTALQHAIENLLSNAAKYGTEASNWIGVTASQAGADGHKVIEIRVADRGPGIPADEQGHIFEPFFRGKRALQDQVHGTGLGLSLVKMIVEAHGGNVEVCSRPGKGTEFLLRIPAAPDEFQDEFAHSAGGG